MKRQGGQSIFEIVLALGFISVVLFALVALIVQTQKNTAAAKNRSEGARMVQEATEWLRSQRDADWVAFYNRSAGNQTWCLNALAFTSAGACGTEMPGKPFRREVRFFRTGGDVNTVRADIRVYWTDSQGNHEIKAPTHFTNWRAR